MNALESPLPSMGILHQMWFEPHVSDKEAIRTAIDEFHLAEELGFDSVWVGEHHLVKRDHRYYGRIPASEMFLSYLAASTSRINVGTGVKILSTSSALRCAEEMSMLHLLTDGRVEFGLGLGAGNPSNVEARNVKINQYSSLLADILRFLQRDQSTGLPELSPTPDPDIIKKIWVAARDDTSIQFAASHDLHFIVGQAELGTIQAKYVRRYREEGGKGNVRGVRIAIVAETDEQAFAESEEAVRTYYSQSAGRSYHKLAVESGAVSDGADTLEEMRRQMNFFVGSPDTVVEQLNAHIETTELNRLDVMAQVPRLPTATVRRSLELINEYVRPRIRLTPLPS